MLYKGYNKTYFTKFNTIRAFGNGTKNDIITLCMASGDQNQFVI